MNADANAGLRRRNVQAETGSRQVLLITILVLTSLLGIGGIISLGVGIKIDVDSAFDRIHGRDRLVKSLWVSSSTVKL